MSSLHLLVYPCDFLYTCAIPNFQVIEKMEKALDGKLREKNKPSGDKTLGVKKQRGRWTLGGEGAKRFPKNICSCQNISSCCVGETDHRKEEIDSALAAENTRLREELDRIRHQPAQVMIQQSAQVLLHIQASIQTEWTWFKTLIRLNSWGLTTARKNVLRNISYIFLYYPNFVLQLLKSKIDMCHVPLRQKTHCHSKRDWVYYINWIRLRQESKHWRLRWKYKKKMRYSCTLHRLIE